MKGTFKAAFTSFTPNQFSLEIDSDQDGFYSVFQNHYPRWRLQIDRASYPIIRTNVSFMGFWLTKGKHKIDFRYKTLDLEIAWLVSLLSSIIIIALLIVQKIKVSFLL